MKKMLTRIMPKAEITIKVIRADGNVEYHKRKGRLTPRGAWHLFKRKVRGIFNG